MSQNCFFHIGSTEAKQLYSWKLSLDGSIVCLISEPLVVVPLLLGDFEPTIVKQL
jgi:hypothetical protein